MITSLSLSFPGWELLERWPGGCGVFGSSAPPAPTQRQPEIGLCECEFQRPGKGGVINTAERGCPPAPAAGRWGI